MDCFCMAAEFRICFVWAVCKLFLLLTSRSWPWCKKSLSHTLNRQSFFCRLFPNGSLKGNGKEERTNKILMVCPDSSVFFFDVLDCFCFCGVCLKASKA